MPGNKNQHFVPRCHLKPFSLNSAGSAINLYSFKSDRLIKDAPLRNQCSKSYFYGNDLEIEKALQPVEGNYAEIVTELLSTGVVDSKSVAALRSFAYLQYWRTEQAIHRTRAYQRGIVDAAFKGQEATAPPLDLSHTAVLRSALRVFAASSDYVDDLSGCIGVNMTNVEFITSDDPTVLTNRFYLQRLKRTNFGFANTGAILMLPVTPRHMLICWDNKCYAFPGRRQHIAEIRRVDDVMALNGFQAITAHANLYFSAWAGAEAVRGAFKAVAHARIEKFNTIRAFVPNPSQEGGFIPLHNSNAREDRRTLVVAQPTYPMPAAWFSGLKWRHRIGTFNDGSAAGYVRPGHRALARH